MKWIMLFFLCSFSCCLHAQNICGVSSVSVAEQMTPQRIRELRTLDSVNNIRRTLRGGMNSPKLIPVVVHVLHQDGAEKISEKAVTDGIEYLNEAYGARGHYQGGMNTNIQFCLVYVDWIPTQYTNFDKTVHNLSAIRVGDRNLGWDASRFMNIYIVKNYIGDPVGTAYNPENSELLFKGVVIEEDWFTSFIGSPCRLPKPSPVPTHEVGHYLGLYHTFQGDCNDFFGLACSLTGDQVCDTPPASKVRNSKGELTNNYPRCNDIPYNSCNSEGNDLENNFMCYNDDFPEMITFTEGQIDRMHMIIERYWPNLAINHTCDKIDNAFFEPNNNPQNATQRIPTLQGLPYQSIIRGSLSSQSDMDIYKITLLSEGKVTIRLNKLNFNHNLYVTDGKNLNLSGEKTGNTSEEIIYSTGGFSGGPKELFIRVSSPNGWLTSDYWLEVNWETCTDIKEPNDNKATALPILSQNLSNSTILTTVGGRISSATDIDYWKIPIDANGEIKLTLFNLPYEYQVQILDPQGSSIAVIASNTPGTTEKVITYRYAIPQSKVPFLYAVVFPAGKGYSKCQDYSLRLEWNPDAPCKKIKLNSTITPASSAGATDGVILLTHTAGTAPYTYTWDNGATTQDLANLAPDKYTVTITAKDGCKLDTAFTVGIKGLTQEPYCSGTTTLTAISGTFSDGSGGQNFRPNSNCKWKIAVPNAAGIELSFTFFDPGRGDVIKIYDGPTTASPLLKTFDVGSDLDRITSTSGTLLVQFISDGADEAGGWTLAYEARFNADNGSVKINSFEYWFDDDFEQRKEVFVIPLPAGTLSTDIETEGLEVGVHAIHFRFFDNNGIPSVVTSDLFVKTDGIAPDTRYITDYEYWFDDDFEGRNGRDVNANATFDLKDDLDVSDLVDGVHVVHHRFRDDLGQWSVISSDLFVKIPPQGEQLIRKYEYWIDEDFEQRFSQDVSPGILDFRISKNLELSQLEDGVHSIHFRFQTAPGVWSATTSDLFVKLPAGQFGERKIAGYEYWFDGRFEKRKVQSVTPKVLHYVHMAQIDTDTLADGLHTFHIRYADDAAQWSVITNDTFAKRASAVVASFMASTDVICNRGEVTFTNNSLRADNYVWDFGDGTSSTAHSPTHFYNNPGSYTVKLKAKNSASEAISTPLLIHVDALNLKISGGNSICWGDSIQLNASGAKTYSWSPKQDLRLISESRVSVYPKTNTNYTLTGSSEHGCKTDTTILIQVNPLPQIVIKNPTNNLCLGGEKTIELSGASTFQISPSNTAKQLSINTFILNPTETTTYTIRGQNQCGTKSERFILSVFPTKSVVLNEKICAGESYTVGGQLFNRKGSYRIVLKTSNGCDSIVTLNLSVFTQGVQSIRSQICKGDSVRVGGKSFSKPGNYQIDITSVNGCDSTIFLNLSEYPSQAIPLIISTGKNEIGCNLIGKSYIWFFNGKQLAITSGQKLTITQSGEYKVQVISNNGCKSELSKSYSFVVVGSTQLRELLTVNIYPNPTNGVLYFAFAKPTTAELFIYAAEGKMVKKESIIRRQTYEIDLSSISPGIYLIRIETKDGVVVKRFVKE